MTKSLKLYVWGKGNFLWIIAIVNDHPDVPECDIQVKTAHDVNLNVPPRHGQRANNIFKKNHKYTNQTWG